MEKYFEFEQQLNADLSCLPLAARQKLDALGIKIIRNQWLAPEMNERCDIYLNRLTFSCARH
jgi:Conserved nitrate reductase-associated protein (Nitr_red_assoc)